MKLYRRHISVSSVQYMPRLILISFVLMSTFVAFSYFFTFSEFGLNGDVDSALVLHIIFSISFLMGYCIFSIFTMIGKYEYKYEYKSKIKLREVLKIGLWFSLLIISLLIIGMISAVNAAVVDMTFGEFFQKWSQGTAGAARIAAEPGLGR
jgi:hypothetical protein